LLRVQYRLRVSILSGLAIAQDRDEEQTISAAE